MLQSSYLQVPTLAQCCYSFTDSMGGGAKQFLCVWEGGRGHLVTILLSSYPGAVREGGSQGSGVSDCSDMS